MKFRKKPVEVEAVKFTGDNWSEMHAFCGHRETSDGHPVDVFNPAGTYVADWPADIKAEVWDWIHTTHVGVTPGQWIIRGTEGEYYPCADDGSGEAPLNYEPA